MWKIKKIIKTVLFFVVAMLVVCLVYSVVMALLFGIKKENTNLVLATFTYFLYAIGYGDVSSGMVSQNIFAMLGVVSISLMSTFLTINLFWRIDDVKVSPKIVISTEKDSDYVASILVCNMGANICRLEGSIITYDIFGNVIAECSQEFKYPLLVKKAFWKITIPVRNTFLYEVFRTMLKKGTNCKLFFTLSFVDTATGQESIKVIEYRSKDLIAVKAESSKFSFRSQKKIFKHWTDLKNEEAVFQEFVKFICQNSIEFDLKNTFIAENGGAISVSYPTGQDEKQGLEYTYLKAGVRFPHLIKSAEQGSFVMAYFNFKSEPLDWTPFCKENAVLNIVLSCSEEIEAVTIEVKGGPEGVMDILLKELMVPSKNGAVNFKYPLKNMIQNRDEKLLSGVKEVCFTLFAANMTKTSGEFCVYSCAIEIPEH